MKTKITNRIVLAFISLILVNLCAYAITIKNTDGVQIYYKFIGINKDDRKYQVTYYRDNEMGWNEEYKYKGIVKIPSDIYSYSKPEPMFIGIVKSIGKNAFYECYELTSVNIPNTVDTIGEKAFCFCTGLTDITIPNGVTIIGDQAFYGCTNIKSINIPSNLTSLGEEAFQGCSGLATSIVLPSGITTVGNAAFRGCENITSITIPGTLIDIPNDLCCGCTSLNSLNINSGVQIIGSGAFSNCKAIESVTLPSSIKTIHGGAFAGCENLSSINIPEGVIQIEMNVFDGCDKIQNFYIPSTLIVGESFPRNAISVEVNTNLRVGDKFPQLIHCKIGDDATCIVDEMFSNSYKLETVSIPNSITSIGIRSFAGCSRLEKISIPNSIHSIGKGAFAGCNISSVSIPSGVEKIEESTFSSCKNLSSVSLPNTVSSIGWQAFSDCSALTSINFLNKVESIEYGAFSSCNKVKEIIIPESVNNIERGAFTLTSVSSIIVDKNNLFYDSRNKCNAIIETAKNTLVVGCNNTIIPSSVKKIGEYAFSECEDLTELEIPNGVESIGERAFLNCYNLTSISLPNSLKELGDGAFGNAENISRICSYMTNPFVPQETYMFRQNILDNAILYVPKGTKAHYKTIKGWKLFRKIVEFDTSDLVPPYYDIAEPNNDDVTVYYRIEENNNDVKVTNGDYSGDVIIPKKIRHEDKEYDVKKIGEDAFLGCDDVTSVTIPESINEIGEEAFDGCIGITDIYVYSETPPTLPDNGFDESTYDNAILHVPENSKEDYEGCEGWKNFKKIEEFNLIPSAIQSTFSKDANVRIKEEYTIDGKQCSVTTKGIGISKMSNGKIVKSIK